MSWNYRAKITPRPSWRANIRVYSPSGPPGLHKSGLRLLCGPPRYLSVSAFKSFSTQRDAEVNAEKVDNLLKHVKTRQRPQRVQRDRLFVQRSWTGVHAASADLVDHPDV